MGNDICELNINELDAVSGGEVTNVHTFTVLGAVTIMVAQDGACTVGTAYQTKGSGAAPVTSTCPA